MEGGAVLARLGEQRTRHLLDAHRVLRRQVHQRTEVAGAPLQPGGRAFALLQAWAYQRSASSLRPSLRALLPSWLIR